jgi:hypothetical protein
MNIIRNWNAIKPITVVREKDELLIGVQRTREYTPGRISLIDFINSMLQNQDLLDVFRSYLADVDGENLGTGVGIYKETIDYSLKFNSLVAGNNISITLDPNTDEITIEAAAGGDGIYGGSGDVPDGTIATMLGVGGLTLKGFNTTASQNTLQVVNSVNTIALTVKNDGKTVFGSIVAPSGDPTFGAFGVTSLLKDIGIWNGDTANNTLMPYGFKIATNANNRYAAIKGFRGSANNQIGFVFEVMNGSGNIYEAMRLTDTGRLGLKTNDPQTELHILGSVMTEGGSLLLDTSFNVAVSGGYLAANIGNVIFYASDPDVAKNNAFDFYTSDGLRFSFGKTVVLGQYYAIFSNTTTTTADFEANVFKILAFDTAMTLNLSVGRSGVFGVGGASYVAPNAAAVLQADATNRGFLPPRMTTAQKNAISTPPAGLMVYDTNLAKLCVYTSAWETITSA